MHPLRLRGLPADVGVELRWGRGRVREEGSVTWSGLLTAPLHAEDLNQTAALYPESSDGCRDLLSAKTGSCKLDDMLITEEEAVVLCLR